MFAKHPVTSTSSDNSRAAVEQPGLCSARGPLLQAGGRLLPCGLHPRARAPHSLLGAGLMGGRGGLEAATPALGQQLGAALLGSAGGRRGEGPGMATRQHRHGWAASYGLCEKRQHTGLPAG